MEPAPGTEREQTDEEDVGMPGLDEGGEIDPDISDEQRTAKAKYPHPPRGKGKKNLPIVPVTSVAGFEAPAGLLRRTDGRFDREYEKAKKLFRGDALKALHSLAMMPITDNSAQNQVKYLAACKLIGELTLADANTGVDGLLANLKEEYKKNAPRIREVRERVVTFEDRPPAQIQG